MRKTKTETAERRNGEPWLVFCAGHGAVVIPGAHSSREAIECWFRGAVPAGTMIDFAEGAHPRATFPGEEERSVWASPLKEALR